MDIKTNTSTYIMDKYINIHHGHKDKYKNINHGHKTNI